LGAIVVFHIYGVKKNRVNIVTLGSNHQCSEDYFVVQMTNAVKEAIYPFISNSRYVTKLFKLLAMNLVSCPFKKM
jgi:hypothetical protein